jgi:hypothetical protein
MGNGFTCRDSHQQAGVDKTSKDCISFEYATEAACTATSKVWISPDWNGIGCSRNDTQFLAKTSYPPPPPPPPPGQFIDNALDGTCCAAFYGVSNDKNANACDQCYGMGNGFTCRDSHQQAGVDKTSKDCISFEYATEAACTATSMVWISPDWNGIGCSRNDTQFLAKKPTNYCLPSQDWQYHCGPEPYTGSLTCPIAQLSCGGGCDDATTGSTYDQCNQCLSNGHKGLDGGTTCDGSCTPGDASDPCFKGFTPPLPPPPPKLVLDDDDHAAGLAGILVALVATTSQHVVIIMFS